MTDTLPQHPRRHALAAEAYDVLVTQPAREQGDRATPWDLLRYDQRQAWIGMADAFAYVVAMDAKAMIALRDGTPPPERTFLTPPPTFDRSSDWFRRDDTNLTARPGVITFGTDREKASRDRLRSMLDKRSPYGRRYVFEADGTVSRVWSPAPPPVPAIGKGDATDTRRTTHHAFDLDPTATGILRRALYAFALTTYPLAAYGLPAGEVACTCDAPTPMRHYGDASPLHPDHQPPADAWLRCVTCRGLYTRIPATTH